MWKTTRLRPAWKVISCIPTCSFYTSITCWLSSFTFFNNNNLHHYFVQLIKTLGRLEPEFLIRWGDDQHMPVCCTLSHPLSHSSPFFAFLMFTSSNRHRCLQGENEMKEHPSENVTNVLESHQVWSMGNFLLFLEKKISHFSFLEGPGWYVWKAVYCSQSPGWCAACLRYNSKGERQSFLDNREDKRRFAPWWVTRSW